MTIEEFLNEFRKVADQVRWGIYGQGSMIINPGALRAVDAKGQSYCPLTWLYYVRSGRRVDEFEAERAGLRLGLTRDDRWAIILASDAMDNDLLKLKSGARFDRELRAKLEEILHLC